MSDDDAKVVLRRLRDIQLMLNTLIVQTNPTPLLDMDVEAEAKGLISRLTDAETAKVHRQTEIRIRQEQHPKLSMFLEELSTIQTELDRVIKWTAKPGGS